MTIPMPEPAAYIHSSSMLSPSPRCVASLAYVSQIDQERGELYEPVITTTQAEAYKDACVREALEEAAQQCEGKYQPWGNSADDRAADCMSRSAARIRVLIPSTPARPESEQ